MRFLLTILLIIFICACTSKSNIEKSAIFLQPQNSIKFVGSTSLENAQAFEKLLAANTDSINTLIINSGGGNVFGGMKIGRLIHEHKLEVIVENLCASSCANYIVTAATRVKIKKDGLLGWHGGATQSIYTPLKIELSWFERFMSFFSKQGADEKVNEVAIKWMSEEFTFFRQIGVQQAITIIGMMPGYIENRDSPLFSYDRETLTRLGLNIIFEDSKQTEYTSDGDKFVQVFTLSQSQLETQLAKHNHNISNKL